MQVQTLALWSLKQPVAGEVDAVVAREAGRDDTARGGIADHSTAGSCETGVGRWAGLASGILDSLTSLSAHPSSVPSARASRELAFMALKVNPLPL